MSQILLLDLGASRLKWGLHGQHGWLAQGVTANADIGTLSLRDWQNLQRPVRAVGVNGANEAARVRVEAQLARWRLPLEWLVATAQGGGIVNRYAKPAQLAPDRYASLVAARRRAVANELFPPPCVVVNAGTCVTIDALDADGVFRGGVILPGLARMRQLLGETASNLRPGHGRYQALPTDNADAAFSGPVQAVCGAIGEMRARLRQEDAGVRCILSGGAAFEIAPNLAGPVEVVDNLVLEGVLALALAQDGESQRDAARPTPQRSDTEAP